MVIIMFVVVGVLSYTIVNAISEKQFSNRIERFVSSAEEFLMMYETLENCVINGDVNDAEVTEFVFEGQRYMCEAEKGDFKSFYQNMLILVGHVQDQYEGIKQSDFRVMDSETVNLVQGLYTKISSRQNQIRYEYWLLKDAKKEASL